MPKRKEKINLKDIKLKKINFLKYSSKYLKWVNDSSITKFTELKKKNINKTDLKNYVLNKKNSKNEFLFGIFFKKKYVGNIKIGPINKKNNSAPIGYLIGEKKYWNRGIASLSIHKIVKFGFQRLSLKTITSNSEQKNFYSSKALIRNKFEKISIKKNNKRKLIVYKVHNPKFQSQ
mgnify:CR=1 FL=1|jgi:[ribosomal protein S5]-alanine N-acetyltransferase|tara:strand:- start:54 stop:581 length:528 start_codon:yes stop_codon:yes gene_type:complete